MNIFVTGGAGYIGSQTVLALQEAGHNVLIFDNLEKGHKEIAEKLQPAKLIVGDLRNPGEICDALLSDKFEAVIHFAAYAEVGESVKEPAKYYQNNVLGSVNLLEAMRKAGVAKIVFSSSCSVYGNPLSVPICESEPIKPVSPYASTKAMMEMVLADYDRSFGIKYISLRYFNAAGADSLGRVGEWHDPESHLIPHVVWAALGKETLKVFGNDYPTRDGTCERDYIHVADLAEAHVKALEYLIKNGQSDVFNLGTEKGTTVLELIQTAEKVWGKTIPYEIVERRPGDPAILVASAQKIGEKLGWQAKYNLEKILADAWQWHNAR